MVERGEAVQKAFWLEPEKNGDLLDDNDQADRRKQPFNDAGREVTCKIAGSNCAQRELKDTSQDDSSASAYLSVRMTHSKNYALGNKLQQKLEQSL